jgi:hypothetical protein
MKNTKIDPTVKHNFIGDRARKKNINNVDGLYEKLNELERNGVLDIWIKKFGKKKYLRESIEIINNILEENGILKVIIDKKSILEEFAATATGGGVAASAPATPATGITASSSNTPSIPYGGEPSKNKLNIKDKYPEPTHQDLKKIVK